MTTRILIDGDILAYKVCWAVQQEYEWEDGVITLACNTSEMESQIHLIVTNWLEYFDPDSYIICFSDKNNFRKKILPDYKGNRKGTRKPMGYKVCVKHVTKHYHTLFMDNLEADDVLGILATDGDYDKNIIISIDKDMKTIPCFYYNMDTWELNEYDEEEADYWHLRQTLEGDATDNYKGCPGVGPVKAEKILADPKYTDWDAVVGAYEKAGLTEEDALQQARVAKILRSEDYDFEKQEVILWNPKV
jgi:DNA polymerase-1